MKKLNRVKSGKTEKIKFDKYSTPHYLANDCVKILFDYLEQDKAQGSVLGNEYTFLS